jgi:hypothetical protein
LAPQAVSSVLQLVVVQVVQAVDCGSVMQSVRQLE